MTLGLCFYIIMLVLLVFGAMPYFGGDKPGWRTGAPTFVIWLLFLLLGWAQFGAPIHG